MSSAPPTDAWSRQPTSQSLSEEGNLGPDALRSLGLLTLALGRETLDAALRGALDSLSSLCQASAMGLWLRGDPSRGVFLTACVGQNRAELLLRPRLEFGQCLPGIALDNGEGVRIASLSRERRLLRRHLRWFGGYVCIPFGPAEGCLEVLLGSAGLPPAEHLALLASAVHPIRDRIARARADQREELVVRLDCARSLAHEAGAPPQDALARTLAVHLQELVGARRVDVLLTPGNPSEEPRRYSSPAGAYDALRPIAGDVIGCGRLHSGCGQCLSTGRRDWPGQCRRLPATVEAPTCLPLLGPSGLLGSVIVDAGSRPPEPVTANAVQLLDACREAARFLSPTVRVEPPAPSAGPRLSITCFGTLQVTIDGVPVAPNAFTRRKARTLLGLLLLEGGKPLDASVLAETLWPEVSETAGRNRLHGVVHCLRQVLEPSPETKRWLYVRNDGHLYHFNVGAPVHVDLVRFKELIAIAREHRRANRFREAAASLADATSIYQADLLTDEPYVDRFESERKEMRRRCLEAHKTLALLRGELGEVDEALAALRRAIALDPYDDDVNIALLRLLADAGRTAEARAAYDAYEEACRRELGVAPSSTMRALRTALGGASGG